MKLKSKEQIRKYLLENDFIEVNIPDWVTHTFRLYVDENNNPVFAYKENNIEQYNEFTIEGVVNFIYKYRKFIDYELMG